MKIVKKGLLRVCWPRQPSDQGFWPRNGGSTSEAREGCPAAFLASRLSPKSSSELHVFTVEVF
jgi:hypothetical protein